MATERHGELRLGGKGTERPGARVVVGEAGGKAPPANEAQPGPLAPVAHRQPQLAQRRGGHEAGEVLPEGLGDGRSDGLGAKGGQPAVIGAGADLTGRATRLRSPARQRSPRRCWTVRSGSPARRTSWVEVSTWWAPSSPRSSSSTGRRARRGTAASDLEADDGKGGAGSAQGSGRGSAAIDMGFCNMGCVPTTGGAPGRRRPQSAREVKGFRKIFSGRAGPDRSIGASWRIGADAEAPDRTKGSEIAANGWPGVWARVPPRSRLGIGYRHAVPGSW